MIMKQGQNPNPVQTHKLGKTVLSMSSQCDNKKNVSKPYHESNLVREWEFITLCQIHHIAQYSQVQ